jgi:hypothetical protein
MQKQQETVTINKTLLKKAAEAAIRRALEKKELLDKRDKLLKNSKLTEADAIKLGRKVNAGLAKRYTAIR